MLSKNVNLLHRIDKINALIHNLRKYSQAASILTTPKKLSTVEELVVDPEYLYPPVKQKYPPGQWGKICADSAWKIHENTHKILQCPSAKWRLEKLAGVENKKLWIVSPLAPRPNSLAFQQLITRSHLIEGVPENLKNDTLRVEDTIVKKSCELIQNIYDQEHKDVSREVSGCSPEEVRDSQQRSFLARVTKIMVGLLGASRKHLGRGQIDEGVRLETFWRVGGFEGEEKSGEGNWEGVETIDGVDVGVLQFQYRHHVDLQLRSEMPLPQFISQDEPVCRVKEVLMPSYAPDAVDLEVQDGRPTSVAGQWIGGACEFNPLSIHHLPSSFTNKYNSFGPSHLEEAEKVFMLSSMFASCMAQAYNQGFCDLLDLTYPITTQCLLSTNNQIRFAAFQLNTTMLWNDANLLQNIAWISPPTPLVVSDDTTSSSSSDPNNENTKINPYFVRLLLRSLLLEPSDRGVNLRPYLPNDPSPLTLDPPINHVGQPPPEHYVPGRWEYPVNAVYF